MPVRPPARCRHGVSLQTLGADSGIWITEDMLNQAVQRYRHQRLTHCRHLSSYLGPLESRRRLGKRQMTAFMPHSRPPTPTWHFTVGPALTSWQWEPPTTRADRERKRTDISSIARLYNGLIDWLEGNAKDEPFILPPEEVAEQTDVVLPTEAGKVDETVDFRTQEIWKLKDRLLSLKKGRVPVKSIRPILGAYLNSVRHKMVDGDITMDWILRILEPLDETIRVHISNPFIIDYIAIRIYDTVLSQLSEYAHRPEVRGLDQLLESFPDMLSDIEPDSHQVWLIWKLSCMNGKDAAAIPYTVVQNMARAYMVYVNSDLYDPARGYIFAATLAAALQQISSGNRQNILEGMRESVVSKGGSFREYQRQVFAWLLVMAHDTTITSHSFIDSCSVLAGDDMELCTQQLWQLLLARLSATGILHQPQCRELLAMFQLGDVPQVKTLTDAVRKSTCREAGAKAIYSLLAGTGTQNGLVCDKRFYSLPQGRELALLVVSAASDHRFALRFIDEMNVGGGLPWSIWIQHAENIIKDAQLGTTTLWKALKRGGFMSAHDGPQAVSLKMQLLEDIARWHSETRHLSERQIFRGYERCLKAYVALGKQPSDQFLASLADFVTWDLDRGKSGRTQRLRWLVSQVAEHRDAASAASVSSQLERWRALVKLFGRREGGS